jgi:hypothetical protein
MLMTRILRCATFALAVGVFATTAGTPARGDEVVALVPAYFYPTWWQGSPWDDLNTAATQIPVEAIMNPASGPGPSANSDYQFAVGQLQAAGGQVIGYIPTGYGAASADEILADVASYMEWYGVDGVFLDEMGNQNGTLDYAALYAAIKQMAAQAGTDLHVVGNPGSPFGTQSLLAAADTLVIFEGPFANADPGGPSFKLYPKQGPYAGLPTWWMSEDRSQIANLVYDTATAYRMAASVTKAVSYNAGYVFVTNDQLPNPWDTLPPYWEDEVCLIRSINRHLHHNTGCP